MADPLYLRLTFSLAVIYAASTSVASADTWDKKTTVNFSRPVEVPGYILQPGKYVIKLADSPSNHRVVQFLNERENRVYAVAESVPAHRSQATNRTVITFYESAAGQPESIRSWYYPGDMFGQEFVYSKEQLAPTVAKDDVSPSALAVPISLDSSPVLEAFPVPDTELNWPRVGAGTPEGSPAVEAKSQEPVEIARAEAGAGEAAVSKPVNAPAELPQTDSSLIVVAVLGVVSIGAALMARKFRRS